MLRLRLSPALGGLLLATPTLAQDPCEGNGHGEAYLEVGPAYVGGLFEHDMGSPNVPFGTCFFLSSDSAALTPHPAVGTVCLDLASPAFNLIVLPTDGTGNAALDLLIPNEPALLGIGPFFSLAATFESGAWSLSKTIPLYFELPDSYSPLKGTLSTPRHFHTATYLGADGRDNRISVLITGGGQGTITIPTALSSTELYDPLTRTFTPGPDMAVERSVHTATRLADGRVLIVGGMDSSGVCTRSSEVYDPVTKTLAPTGDLGTERASHTATLLGDGRVLVTGGYQDYTNPDTAFATALASAQTTAEVWDPATGTWSPTVTTMSSKRAGHTATLLADGRVLLIGGVISGVSTGSISIAPVFTNTVDVFDPVTDLVVSESSMPTQGRAYHRAGLLPDGKVLVTGGVFAGGTFGEATATTAVWRWNNNEPGFLPWSTMASLEEDVGWHTQVPHGDGFLIQGGIEGPLFSLAGGSLAATHSGSAGVSSLQPVTEIGLNPGLPGSTTSPRGNHTATVLHDGSVLILGGYDGNLGVGSEVHADGFLYTPAP